MSNRSLIIMVLVLIGATAYLLLKGDGDIDMGGEKHGAEATHVEEKRVQGKKEILSCDQDKKTAANRGFGVRKNITS